MPKYDVRVEIHAAIQGIEADDHHEAQATAIDIAHQALDEWVDREVSGIWTHQVSGGDEEAESGESDSGL